MFVKPATTARKSEVRIAGAFGTRVRRCRVLVQKGRWRCCMKGLFAARNIGQFQAEKLLGKHLVERLFVDPAVRLNTLAVHPRR